MNPTTYNVILLGWVNKGQVGCHLLFLWNVHGAERVPEWLRWVAPPEGVRCGEMESAAGKQASQLMLSESERSRHVFWQLTRWVWILQHKVGPFFTQHMFTGKCAFQLFSHWPYYPTTVMSLAHYLSSASHFSFFLSFFISLVPF